MFVWKTLDEYQKYRPFEFKSIDGFKIVDLSKNGIVSLENGKKLKYEDSKHHQKARAYCKTIDGYDFGGLVEMEKEISNENQAFEFEKNDEAQVVDKILLENDKQDNTLLQNNFESAEVRNKKKNIIIYYLPNYKTNVIFVSGLIFYIFIFMIFFYDFIQNVFTYFGHVN